MVARLFSLMNTQNMLYCTSIKAQQASRSYRYGEVACLTWLPLNFITIV